MLKSQNDERANNLSILDHNRDNPVSAEANTTEFSMLEAKIRSGSEPNCPELLLHYLQLAESFTERQSKSLRFEIYTRILDLLIETICDDCVVKHWRSLCLEHSYRPLVALKRLVTNQQERRYVNQQYYKFRTLSHYFC